MSIGYACLAVAVPGSDMKSCIRKHASEERLLSLIDHNLSALATIIEYNIGNGIQLFRISSGIIPFGSSVAAQLPWSVIFQQQLSRIGSRINQAKMRVSMHPGQYTVLNSPDPAVVERAIDDLNYHTKVLDALGLGPEHKLVLHLGGVYGHKRQAIRRFLSHYEYLDNSVRRRLVLENDALYNIAEVLEAAASASIPVVYDNLHNVINPVHPNKSDLEWIRLCAQSWQAGDGPQKTHYSQQDPKKQPGAHSPTIAAEEFVRYYDQLTDLDIDIMLEVKDKNLSALKCTNCVSNRGIKMLEREWARYKYVMLERSSASYLALRRLLQDKTAYPALQMYRTIEKTMHMPFVTGNAVNAAQHVWGYFKEKATDSEKKRFERLLAKYSAGEIGLGSVKRNLQLLAQKYQEDYLLASYYFYL